MNAQAQPEMDERDREWWRLLIKGRLQSYVARGNDDLNKVIKATRTLMVRCGISSDALAAMFEEIYRESVRSFLEQPVSSLFYQPDRAERFRLLRAALL